LVEWIEERFIPRCDYVTAASDGIADAYATALRIERPTTILNVCPMDDRERTAPRPRERETPPGAKSLYWFSQTIGPGRGLEDAVDALAFLGDEFVLHLRGRWAQGYELQLRNRARAKKVDDRLRWLPLVPPSELVPRSKQHEIGLALEHPTTENRSICLTNKIFTYLAAGIPIVATSTVAQRELAGQLGAAARLYDPGDAAGLADRVRDLIADPTARAASRSLAIQRFNWEAERERFLKLVRDQVGPPRPR
jgi:glycosyltransferase involved in cell wall biosynthesis